MFGNQNFNSVPSHGILFPSALVQFGCNTPYGATNMFHLLASLAEAAQDEKDLPRDDPTALVVLDSTNAFTEQKRQSIYDNMMDCCRAQCPPGLPEHPGSENSPYGWDILAGYIQAHYSVKGILKYHVNGSTIDILSESGVQQGDTLGSILYAKTAHPSLIRDADSAWRKNTWRLSTHPIRTTSSLLAGSTRSYQLTSCSNTSSRTWGYN